MNTLASGTYPLAHALYLYVDKRRLNSTYFIEELVLDLASPPSYLTSAWRRPAFWAFVPLDPTEQAALRKDRYRFKPLQF